MLNGFAIFIYMDNDIILLQCLRFYRIKSQFVFRYRWNSFISFKIKWIWYVQITRQKKQIITVELFTNNKRKQKFKYVEWKKEIPAKKLIFSL